MGAATQNAQRKPTQCSHLAFIVCWIALGAALGATVVVTSVPSLQRMQQRVQWRHGTLPADAGNPAWLC